MNEVKPGAIKQEVFDLYDDYAHDRIDRREFAQKLAVYAVGGLTVASLMSFLMPDYVGKIQLKPDDPRLQSDYVTYPSPKGGGSIKALVSMPVDTKKKLGAIVVVHENRGLNPHIEDVARRAALAGFVSIAPDALTPLGGYPGTDDAGRELQSKRDKNEMQEDFIAAYDYIRTHKNCSGKVGVVGFLFWGRHCQHDGRAHSGVIGIGAVLRWSASHRRCAQNKSAPANSLCRIRHPCQ